MNALRPILIATALLAGFASVGTGIVALVHHTTAPRIAENERQTLLARLHEVLPPAAYDNALEEDHLVLRAPGLGGTEPVTVYRARYQGEPVAAIFSVPAPDGYGGPIRLLIGIDTDGRITGVRVLTHSETPGLGDAIEVQRSDWIEAFTGRSLNDPPPQRWRVRRDGGEFEQFTGATITPRAVVRAVYQTLVYFDTHREKLFTAPAASPRNGI
ncbi:electron transport complex subunit RsxG [Alkalilimnicola ehrlichii]|uniref:Ion-translocating oxidoreductase complex subunit G n=1 Tax=Alkalilimnicola ehrlichii TaxID=351052 RepID=A0A3E0WHN1_9GAMM|nr:electron transport complex subunit RsxG [Alkalilimnicola ehrlichii]RFA24595.1 electron transport complex subunit RsxG [Alkalilimnicola ehrlichii]RFA31671.1 electron transport complex subunit RsxG [Alkalilimnicola ehrlichii]